MAGRRRRGRARARRAWTRVARVENRPLARAETRRGFRSRSIERARGGRARVGGVGEDVLKAHEGARSRPRRIEGGVWIAS